MLMKFFSFVLIFATLSSHVVAGTHKGIKAAFDELHYSLSVEWDQKDQAFFNQKSEAFTKDLLALQKSGISNHELMDQILTEVKDKRVAGDLEATFSLMSLNALSPEEANRQVKSILEKSYQTGASWNGGSVLMGMALMIAIIAVVGVVYQEQIKKEGERCYMAWKCHDHCTLTGCNQVCGEECI